VVPGHAATVYVRGFTNISALAFDRSGRLLVLEIDRAGLRDAQASGALIRVERDGSRVVLAAAQLHDPTGLAVAADGSIYVSARGTAAAGGELLRITGT
jgi:sugar lactone lactonase YvrE